MIKKLLTFQVTAALAACLLAGCGGGAGSGSNGTASVPSGAAGEYAVIAEGDIPILPADPVTSYGERTYSGTHVNPGHWEKTDELFFGPEPAEAGANGITVTAGRGENGKSTEFIFEVTEELNASHQKKHDCRGEKSAFSLRYSDIKDRYAPAERCEPHLTIQRRADTDHTPGEIFGAMYFADAEEVEGASRKEISVREYFTRVQGPLDNPVEMSRFGLHNKTLSGQAKDASGAEEFYFNPGCRFPELVEEGEKIYLVLELTDGITGTVKMHDVWEYTWIPDTEPPAEEQEDHEDDPDFRKEIYAGHWDKTDVIYVGSGMAAAEGVGVLAQRFGTDGQNRVYTFSVTDDRNESGEEDHSCKEETLTLTIPGQQIAERYYAGDPLLLELKIFAQSDADHTPGSVDCSFLLANVEFGEDNAVTFTPVTYPTEGYQKNEVRTFSPETMSWRNDLNRGLINLTLTFPEGQTDGEKLYLVHGTTDSITGECTLYNLYEFTWTDGPDTVWIYNPGMTS